MCALFARGQVNGFDKVTFEWSPCRSGVHQALCVKGVPSQECRTEAPSKVGQARGTRRGQAVGHEPQRVLGPGRLRTRDLEQIFFFPLHLSEASRKDRTGPGSHMTQQGELYHYFSAPTPPGLGIVLCIMYLL